MTDRIERMPAGSLDDSGSSPLVPERGEVVYALEPKDAPQDTGNTEESNFWSRLPFLKNRKKKK